MGLGPAMGRSPTLLQPPSRHVTQVRRGEPARLGGGTLLPPEGGDPGRRRLVKTLALPAEFAPVLTGSSPTPHYSGAEDAEVVWPAAAVQAQRRTCCPVHYDHDELEHGRQAAYALPHGPEGAPPAFSRMSHQETYRQNEAYAQFLAGWDEGFYAKYADTLKPQRPGARALDIGCGVGQVVARLTGQGFEAYGVDVSEPNIARARQVSPRCQLYNGKTLPFPDRHFASVGSLNVLEHVDEPEAFLGELVRVAEIGGRVLVSSPNFLRVIGFRDYHPRMRGLGQKWRNWKRLQEKRRQMDSAPKQVRFDRMPAIVKEPFAPDDDAIVATNALELEFFLTRAGCQVERVDCTDRYVAKPLDLLLNLTPLRYLMFNAFVVARRIRQDE
jgi:2-polyprenyl-3-methyl-5-hydroxy-6-metoxy-1,4-benzoquinol methylase